MEHIFLRVLNMSVAASYVIAAVLLLRLPLRKLPKKVSYPLWSVVAFRLCCPVTWQSVFSLFRLTPASAASTQVTAGGGSRLEYFPVIPGNTMPAAVQAGASLPQSSEAADHALQAAAPVPGVDPLQIAVTAGTVLWCAGIAALLLYSVVCCGKMHRQMRTAVLLRDNIYQSDRVRSPFLLGLIHPKIYIPYGLDADTLKYVLAHEQYHIRRKDYLIKPLAFLLLTVHWFNPLCWLSFHLMNRDMEMSCDEKVLNGEGTSVKAYSMTLLSFAANRRFPAPSPLAFGETGVKSRIKNVLRWKKPKAWMTLLAAVLCILAVVACAANPEQKADPAPPEEQTALDPPEEQTDSVKNTPVDSDDTEQPDGEGNTLLENASPSTSALRLYAYDGEAVTYGYLFHTETAQEILDALSAVNVKKVDGWSPELITLPVYGLEIGGSDGWSVKAAWSNGY